MALSASQLRAILPGSMLRGRSGAYGLNIYLYLSKEGTAVMSFEVGAISGPYRITDDGLLCMANFPPGPGERCCTFYQQGEQYKLFYSNGELAMVATRVLGQDEHFLR